MKNYLKIGENMSVLMAYNIQIKCGKINVQIQATILYNPIYQPPFLKASDKHTNDIDIEYII